MNKTESSLFLRPVEAAELLSVSKSRVYEMLNARTLPAVRLEGRTWRIPRVAIEQLVANAMKEIIGDEKTIDR